MKVIDINCIQEINEFEKEFSSNQYKGNGTEDFVIKEGKISVMISAPHTVQHLREGKVKAADVYTGGISKYLQKETDCHLIYSCNCENSDPNYDMPENNVYQRVLKEYIESHAVRVLIDLHGASRERKFALEIGTVPIVTAKNGVAMEVDSSLKGYSFIAKAIENIFKEKFSNIENEKKEIWKNKIFNAGSQNTVTKYISENTDIPSVQIEINRIYRNPKNVQEFCALVEGLKQIVVFLSEYRWDDSSLVK